MCRRRLTLPIFVTLASLMAAVSCSQEAVDGAGRVATDAASRDGGASGFGAGGTDARMPARLPAPASPSEFPARIRRQASSVGAAGGTAGKVAPEPGEHASSAATFPAQPQQPGAMLIRAGNAVVEVDSVQVGIARVRRLAQESGAVVANTTVQTGREQRRSASLELRIPSERFDAVVNGLSPIGKVESVNISVQDVGEEFVDLTARVANARRLEARLIELLANRTGRLSDVLTVERELARVREEIERYEGRLRYLQSRISVSSLTVTVHEPPPVVASRPGENVIADAFVQAWRSFVLLIAGFIASLGVLIPIAALGAGGFVIWRRYGGRRPEAAPQA